VQQLNGLVSFGTVVQELIRSQESQTRFVRGSYEAFLHRPADPLGLQYTLDLLQSNTAPLEKAAVNILASPEFVANAQATVSPP
jgi:hypothetical protein